MIIRRKNALYSTACLLFALIYQSSISANETQLEYKIKSAFIINILFFVQWPNSTLNNGNLPIDLCIFGKDPFGQFINQINEEKGKQFLERTITITRISDIKAMDSCNAVFIPKTEMERFDPAQVKKQSVLLIGESEGFARDFGIINFYIEDERVHMEVNLNRAKQAGLYISSQLLKISKVISKVDFNVSEATVCK